MKRLMTSSFILAMTSIAAFIGWVFWQQELQYSLPTPVPKNFVNVKIGAHVDLSQELGNHTKSVVLHFFNADCPCSRFNMDEFESLAHDYNGNVDFIVVLQSDDEDAVDRFKRKYDLDIPAVLDRDGSISDKCGIYSTPQAVLLTSDNIIYYKGNYNTARYCTRKETKFVAMALENLMAHKPLPLSIQYAMSEPYGCTLPSDENDQQQQSSFSLF